jgi:hypothetical protein
LESEFWAELSGQIKRPGGGGPALGRKEKTLYYFDRGILYLLYLFAYSMPEGESPLIFL